jgi:hypothetical protein
MSRERLGELWCCSRTVMRGCGREVRLGKAISRACSNELAETLLRQSASKKSCPEMREDCD